MALATVWNPIYQSSTVQDQILIGSLLILCLVVIFAAGFVVATLLWFHLDNCNTKGVDSKEKV